MSRIPQPSPDSVDASKQVHNPFVPEDVRANDLISVRYKGSNDWKNADVYKISPLGVELIKDSSSESLSVGDRLDLEIRIDQQLTKHTGVVVDNSYSDHSRALIGIRLVSELNKMANGEERRKGQRFYTAPAFLPTASAVNPLKFNDILLFRVQELSSEGMFLTTSLRNKLLFKDIEMDLLLNFPVFGTISVSVKIMNTRIVRDGDKDCLGLGIRLVGRTEEYKRMAGSYLLQFSNIDSLAELKEAGLGLAGIGSSVEFRYAKTEEDYRKVLELRKLTYAAEGKADPDAPIESMATALDSKARLVMGYFHGKLVASAAVIFHEINSSTEHEDYIQWTGELPPKGNLVEINRVCTHPDFRRADLFLKLYKFMLVLVVQSKKQNVVICASEELVPLYQKLGFDLTSLKYAHAKLNNKTHWILQCDVYKKVSGYGVDPITWNYVLDGILPFLVKHAKDKGIPLDYTRLYVYRLFKPLMKLLIRAKPRVASRSLNFPKGHKALRENPKAPKLSA